MCVRTVTGLRTLSLAALSAPTLIISDRYTFEDPRTILDNFFRPVIKGARPKYYSGLKDSSTGDIDRKAKAEEPTETQDLVNDSCIDWGALSPKEIAAAFVMLKGGRREDAESLLSEVLESVKGMGDADWGAEAKVSSSFFQADKESDPSKAKYYSGM